MDISSLTNLITAFRAETRQNSITPDTLGPVYRKIKIMCRGEKQGKASVCGRAAGVTCRMMTVPAMAVRMTSDAMTLRTAAMCAKKKRDNRPRKYGTAVTPLAWINECVTILSRVCALSSSSESCPFCQESLCRSVRQCRQWL